MAEARLLGRRFFSYGEFLRPPKIQCPATVSSTWIVGAKQTAPVTMPAVLGACWRSREGELGMPITNLAAVDHVVEVYAPDELDWEGPILISEETAQGEKILGCVSSREDPFCLTVAGRAARILLFEAISSLDEALERLHLPEEVLSRGLEAMPPDHRDRLGTVLSTLIARGRELEVDLAAVHPVISSGDLVRVSVSLSTQEGVDVQDVWAELTVQGQGMGRMILGDLQGGQCIQRELVGVSRAAFVTRPTFRSMASQCSSSNQSWSEAAHMMTKLSVKRSHSIAGTAS